MADYTGHNRLAEHHQSLGHAYTVATPAAVLALIAENERVNTECKQLILLECHGGTAQAAVNLLAERDQLKAENDELRKALSELLDLYDTDEGCRSLPQYIAGRAAMGKREQS